MYVTVPVGPGGGLRYIWGGKKSNEMGFDGGSLGRVGSNQIKLPLSNWWIVFVVWICFLILLFFIFCLVTCNWTEETRKEERRGNTKEKQKTSKGCGWARRGKIYSSELLQVLFLLVSCFCLLGSFWLLSFSFSFFFDSFFLFFGRGTGGWMGGKWGEAEIWKEA